MTDHVIDALDCWCAPDRKQVCPECEDHKKPPPDCWRCGGDGLVPMYDESLSVITVHRDFLDEDQHDA